MLSAIEIKTIAAGAAVAACSSVTSWRQLVSQVNIPAAVAIVVECRRQLLQLMTAFRNTCTTQTCAATAHGEWVSTVAVRTGVCMATIAALGDNWLTMTVVVFGQNWLTMTVVAFGQLADNDSRGV